MDGTEGMLLLFIITSLLNTHNCLLLLIFMLLSTLCTVSNLAEQLYTNKSFTEQTQSQICSLLTAEVPFSYLISTQIRICFHGFVILL